MFDRLDHHDGVIDNDANGQHESEQGQGIEAETDHGHRRERADDGHRHGDERYDGWPPALQEYEHNQRHENHRIAERLEHLVHRLADEWRGVVADFVDAVFRKITSQLLHLGLDQVGGFQRVGIRQLKDGQAHRGLAVETVVDVLATGAQFDAANVPNAHDLSALGRTNNDILELFRLGQPAERRKGDLQQAARAGRWIADLPGRNLQVLLAQRVDHVAHGQISHGHFVRVDPHSHAVIALAEHQHFADARQTREFVANAHQRVIAQIKLVVAAFGRVEADGQQNVGRALAGGDSGLAYDVRQLRHGQRDTILHQHLGQVQVDAGLERHCQRVGTVVRALRGHVEHVLHAVDLLFNRRGHGFGHDLGVAPG